MKKFYAFIIYFLLMLTAAQSWAMDTSTFKDPFSTPVKTGANTIKTAPALPIKKGMSYDKARKNLLVNGWRPHPLPINGYHKDDDKVSGDCSGSVKLCNALPEIDSCSGSGAGYCLMRFFNCDGTELRVTTTGGISETRLNDTTVDSWEMVKSKF